MNGIDAARAKAAELKAEKEEVEVAQEESKAVALSQLQAIKENGNLAKMYEDNAAVGAENISGSIPYLKVHSTGKSTKNELANGEEPNNGWFFYQPTQEQFESPTVHILTVSQGFKAEGMPDANGQTKLVFTQIVGGLIVEEGDYKPFIMFFTGTKLNKLWEFGKVVSKYTHAKPFKIPMFALRVKLTTEKIKTTFGNSLIVNFEVEKNEDGSPKLVSDEGEFQFLKDSVEQINEQIQALIGAKTLTGSDENIQSIDIPESSVVTDQTVSNGVTVDPNDIPF